MKREEAEAKIVEKLKEIREIVNAYNPDDEYLTMCFFENGYIAFNNRYWDHENDGVLNYTNIYEIEEGGEK